MKKSLTVNPAVYQEVWRTNQAQLREIEMLRMKLANITIMLEASRKRCAQAEASLRAARDAEQRVAARIGWGNP